MDISIVIPVYNEAQSIIQLYEELVNAATLLRKPFEIIFVDDGSTDNTPQVLKEICVKAQKNRIHISCMRFPQNLGKSACLLAGFEESEGDIVITMDGDLQDNPGEIHGFIEKIDEGYDLVSGWRFKRRDSFTKIMLSKLFNAITFRITRIPLHDFNCCFKAYRRKVIDKLDIYGDLYRFIPALVFQKGFRIAEIKVEHRPRLYGRSKYGLERIPDGFFGLLTIFFLTKFLRKPLYFFGKPGMLSSFFGFLVIAVLYLRKFILGIPIRENQFLFFLGLLFIIAGLQFLSIGLLGELIVRLNPETRERAHYHSEKMRS